ncbi:MAG TPA: septum formation initiator family protein [Jatrophihabitantaceae bacterium]|jgi:cell division protein FtsB|nr:septum formation initiator family protein [Jatrophihabitantaceae bacterium]
MTLRRPVTGRALVLGAAVVLLVVLLASPLHRYLSSRSALQQAQQQGRISQQQLALLQQQQQQLQEPAYIEQQARVQLRYALPGDTVYTVVQAGQQPSLGTEGPISSAPPRAAGDSWNSRLWGSVQAADGSR